MAAEVAENPEWSYLIAREIIGFGHRRAESRYNERMVEKQYKPGSLGRVQQHIHPYSVPSKLNPKFSGLRDSRSTRPDSDSERTRHK